MQRKLGVALLLLAATGGALTWAYVRTRGGGPLEWGGFVEAHTIRVGSRAGGRVQRVLVSEGESVSAGQTLLVLEPGDLEAQRIQAYGQKRQAEAAFERLGPRYPNPRNGELAAARARLEGAQAVLERSVRDRRRVRAAFDAEDADAHDLDQAETAVRTALAKRDEMHALLVQIAASTPHERKAALGQIDLANGKLAQIHELIEELTVRAPTAGRVESIDLRNGEMLPPNTSAVVLIDDADPWLRIYVPETQLGFIRPGLQVEFFVDSFPDRTFQATVESVRDVGEYTPRNLQTADERADQVFAARLSPVDGKDVLRAGMAATVRVPR